jgi:hypothetical protein
MIKIDADPDRDILISSRNASQMFNDVALVTKEARHG